MMLYIISLMDNTMCAGSQLCAKYINYIFVMRGTHQGTNPLSDNNIIITKIISFNY